MDDGRHVPLGGLYPQLIRHGMEQLGSREVLRFLGRRVPAPGGVHGKFEGEVTTDLRRRHLETTASPGSRVDP